jgi:predicted N-acetyltransferase YhbS
VSRASRVLLERLDAHHDVSTYDSGNEVLDAWLRRHALAAQRMNSARTFVATRNGRVIGYFSLTMGSVLRAEAPEKLIRGMPAYPVGMVLLARLAVDQSQQGRGVGAMLLAEALRKAVAAGEVAATRLIVVDAVDEDAAAFYQRYGFVRTPENPLRFYRGTKDVRASLDSSADG